MDMYQLKWTRLQAKIFRLLCIRAGQSFNIRSLARLLKVSPTAVSKSLLELKKEDSIKLEKSKTMNLISIEFNRDNDKLINLKRVENLRMLYESGLDKFLENNFPACTIILFGSYSKGEDIWFGETDDRSSDIDIAIIGTKGKEIDLTEFNKMLERVISINFYKSWDNIHKYLKNNILNGIILSGSVDL